MITYLQKYNQLPKDIRAKISAPEVLSAISEIEKKHNVSLAGAVMRVMVKDIALVDLVKYFVFEYNIDGRYAAELVEELKARVFKSVADYLGFNADEKRETDKGDLNKWIKDREDAAAVRSSNFFFSPEDEEEVRELAKTVANIGEQEKAKDSLYGEKANEVIKKSGISLGSEDLINRLNQIIKIFFRGTRNKIDTKLALTRAINQGGMGFDEKTADSILSIAFTIKEQELKKEAKIKPPAKIKLPDEEKIPVIKNGIAQKEEKRGQAGGLRGGARDIGYDFSKLAAKKPPAGQAAPKKADDKKLKLTAPKSLPPAINLKEEKTQDDTGALPEKEEPAAGKDTAGISLDKKEIFSESGKAVIDLKNEEKAETPARPKPEGLAPKEPETTKSPELNQPEPKPTAPGGLNIVKGNFKPEAAVKRRIGEDEKNKDEKKKDGAPGNISMAEARKNVDTDGSITPGGKVKMEDIKYVPKAKLMGPLDELKEMSLVDFRRLSNDPKKAAATIKEKIKLLEDDNYGLRLAGIKAWRECPVNKLYLEVGQFSISHHKSIETVIKEKEKEGKETLTNEEFIAIMDLNKDLRF